MKIELQPLDQGWDDIVSSYEHTLFETSLWATTIRQGYRCDVFLILLKEDSRILLGVPAMVLDFKFMKLLLAFYPYGNFFGNKDYLPVFFQKLNDFLSNRSLAHKIRFTDTCNDPITPPLGYKKNISWQHVLDLRNKTEESLWTGYKKRVRRDIRKAKRSGIIISEIENDKEIDNYCNLYAKTMIRNRAFRPHTNEFYKAIYHNLIKNGKASLFLAKLETEIIGGLMVLYDNDTAYYLGNASNAKYLRLCPNDLLLNYAIIFAIKRNLKSFDFMTTSYDDISLLKFKEKWGPERLTFNTYEKDLSFLRTSIWEFLRKANQTRIGTYIFNKLNS